MKQGFLLLVAIVGGVAIGSVLMSRHLRARYQQQMTEERAAWEAERAELEQTLQDTRAWARNANSRPLIVPAQQTAAPTKITAREILTKLVALKAARPNEARTLREAIYWLEELAMRGESAFPAIREFLARNEDFGLAFSQNKATRSAAESILPASLRIALFDVVKRIGGKEAEVLLAEVLNTTGRGSELAWLARALQEIAPNRYRDSALESARELLAQPTPANANRDSLFDVLIFFGDSSYVSTAQQLVVGANGKVDRSALEYLRESLGPQALPMVAQWYDDPRIQDPSEKELLARVALDYVGVDPQADPLYTKAIYDPALPDSNRNDLIKGLKDGPDEVMKPRIEFVEGLLTSDPANPELRATHTDLVKKAAGTNP